jgi:hypothetical protein
MFSPIEIISSWLACNFLIANGDTMSRCCEMKQDNVLYSLALFALVFLRISKPKNCVMARQYRIFHNSFNPATRNLHVRII